MAARPAPQSAKDRASAIGLDEVDVSDPELWRTDSHWPYFERLRRQDPVHVCRTSQFGPYWSITKYKDIMEIDTKHKVFSSEAALGGITIDDETTDLRFPMFIAMDPPKHGAQRKAINPVVSPVNLARLEPLIRERAQRTLDNLPRGEIFDWVGRVYVQPTAIEHAIANPKVIADKMRCPLDAATALCG